MDQDREAEAQARKLAADWQVPFVRVIFDFDLSDPGDQTLGTEPFDLTGVPHEYVKTLLSESAIISIVAHQGEGQQAAVTVQT